MWGTGAIKRPERERARRSAKQGGNMHYLAAPTPLFNVLPALSVMCCGVADEWAGTTCTHAHTHTHTHAHKIADKHTYSKSLWSGHASTNADYQETDVWRKAL